MSAEPPWRELLRGSGGGRGDAPASMHNLAMMHHQAGHARDSQVSTSNGLRHADCYSTHAQKHSLPAACRTRHAMGTGEAHVGSRCPTTTRPRSRPSSRRCRARRRACPGRGSRSRTPQQTRRAGGSRHRGASSRASRAARPHTPAARCPAQQREPEVQARVQLLGWSQACLRRAAFVDCDVHVTGGSAAGKETRAPQACLEGQERLHSAHVVSATPQTGMCTHVHPCVHLHNASDSDALDQHILRLQSKFG
jgi:hypothetical protein